MAGLDPSQITVTSTSPGVTVIDGTTEAAPLDPYGSLTVTARVRLAADAPPQALVNFDVRIDNASSFNATVSGALTHRSNVDEPPNSSAVDTVETESTPWAVANTASPTTIWNRDGDLNAGRFWHGDNIASNSDGTLESPDVVVGAGPFSLKFDHAFSFESGGGTNYDGAVLEFKEIGGAGGDWLDVATLGVDPGYTGTIDAADPNNPLGGRQGFTGASTGFPGKQPVALDFGTQLAGKTVRFRFRIGTDSGVGAPGWDIDNIAVTGANTPFPSVGDDGASCATAPVSNAGADQIVKSGDLVTLDASGSTDPDGSNLTYVWTQTNGAPVSLSGGNGQKPTFVAPAVTVATNLVFEVRVSDGAGQSTDSVLVTVTPDTGAAGSGGGSGAAGQAGQAGQGGGNGAAGEGGGGQGGGANGEGGGNGAAGDGGAAGGGAAGGGNGAAGGGNGAAGAGGSAGSGTGGKAGSGTGGKAGSGAAGTVTNPGGGDDDDDGCGCSTVGSQETPARTAWLPALAAGLAVWRRRRQRRESK
ncbi:MAG: PKD domain-containing protein [Polyangiaceae bacterium]|nr:PKD domain-containing protein [Polyangiaceae bacterium]